MHDRGRIRHSARASQLKDYSGLKYGKITPSDIDGCVEFGGKLFIFMEFKTEGAPFLRGQELMLERLVGSIHGGGKIATALVAEHNTPIGEEIACHAASVVQYLWSGRWMPPASPVNVRDFVDVMRSKAGIK